MPLRCLVFLLALMLLPANPAVAAPLDKVLQYLNDNADAVRAQWGTPGLALAVVQGDKVVFSKCCGVRKAGDPAPVTPDTVFQIASISKSFTASLAATEIAAGRLSPKDRVIDHRPDFKMYDPWVTREFTVEDLMAQRSGLPTAGGDLQLMFGRQRSEMPNGLQYIRPVSSFRSEFAYQNVPFIVAASIVERLTGLTWEQAVDKRLFVPLAMKNAGTDQKSFTNSMDHAALHQMQGGKAVALPDNWPWMYAAYTVGPAGGINASLSDMAHYLIMHMNHGRYGGAQVVDAAALDNLHQPRTRLPGGVLGRTAFYCQGFVWEECGGYTLIWHNGSSSGHQSILVFDPDAQVGLVVLSNLTCTSLPEHLALILFRMLHDQPLKPVAETMEKMAQASRQPKPGPALPAKAAAPRSLADYDGEYENPVHGTLYISNQPVGLLAKLGKGPGDFRLTPLDAADTFWLELPYVDEDASGTVVFARDQNNKVTSAALEKFVENGAGVFTRKQGASRP